MHPSIQQLRQSMVKIKLNIKLPTDIKNKNTNILFKWFIDNNIATTNTNGHQMYIATISVINNIKIIIRFELDILLQSKFQQDFHKEDLIQQVFVDIYNNGNIIDINKQLFFDYKLERYIIKHYHQRTNKWVLNLFSHL